MLRSPVTRYLSEWRHVRRGNEWTSARLSCNGRQASLDEVPFCFSSKEAASKILIDKNGIFDRELGDLKGFILKMYSKVHFTEYKFTL